MIHNKVLVENEVEQYENNPDFQEFLNREFNKCSTNATMEELVEFAFGSVDNAIKAFEEFKNGDTKIS